MQTYKIKGCPSIEAIMFDNVGDNIKQIMDFVTPLKDVESLQTSSEDFFINIKDGDTIKIYPRDYVIKMNDEIYVCNELFFDAIFEGDVE